jgi:hypothetical protein
MASGKIIRYYAAAVNAKGQIEQVLVVVVPGDKTRQEWTGHIYKSNREASRELERLNSTLGLEAING